METYYTINTFVDRHRKIADKNNLLFSDVATFSQPSYQFMLATNGEYSMSASQDILRTPYWNFDYSNSIIPCNNIN